MKDAEAQNLADTVKKEFPCTHVVIAKQPGRSAEWAIVKVHESASSLRHFTLTSAQEYERLKEIMAILLSVEAMAEWT